MRQVIINKQIRKEMRAVNILSSIAVVGNFFNYFITSNDEFSSTNLMLFVTNMILILIFLAIMEVYFAIRIKDNDIEYIKK